MSETGVLELGLMINHGAVGKHLLDDRDCLAGAQGCCSLCSARLGRDAANPEGDAELLRRERQYRSFSSRAHLASIPPCSAESLEKARKRAEQRQEREGRSRLWQPHPGGLWAAGADFISIPLLSQPDEGEERCRRPFCVASFSFYRIALSLPPDAERLQ